MLAHTIFFYFFSIITIGSALMVIVSKNTVHAVFFLILDFISVGCLFIMIGAEFLGMIMMIVYVGAVAVLFLFVVMMLNVSEQKQSWFRGQKSTHIPVGLIVSSIILLELLVVLSGWKYKTNFLTTKELIIEPNSTNTHDLGNILYTEYIHLFQVAGVILLLSMIGAIVLTYRKRDGVKTQSYINQVSREKQSSIKVVEVDFDKGVKIND
jgi:NADH-quinone oxidoreductase subunit J